MLHSSPDEGGLHRNGIETGFVEVGCSPALPPAAGARASRSMGPSRGLIRSTVLGLPWVVAYAWEMKGFVSPDKMEWTDTVGDPILAEGHGCGATHAIRTVASNVGLFRIVPTV